MHSIEFLNYPIGEQPSALRWGFRIDGTDLRAYAADATHDLWRRERLGKGPAEEQRFLRAQHEGLHLSEVGDPVRHFLGDPAPNSPTPPPAPLRSWAAPAATGPVGPS
ncbi:hypothetical protein ACIRL2_27835 [Embleya sp. NPDC127516]|uniref:hypothetical protein n=1 Tax=Embleya sp. NPDC127516 TaxID=3363990 RepID=UPI0037F13094